MAKVTLRNGADTSLLRDRPKANYLKSMHLRMGDGARAFIYHPRPVPLGATILSAKLRLFSRAMLNPADPDPRTLTVRRIKRRQAYNRMHWSRPPVLHNDAVQVTKTGPLPWREEWELDVTAHVQKIADGEQWLGWLLTMNDPQIRNFYSVNSPYPPELEIEWADEPDQPQDLVPSGGLAVSTPKPTLRFDYVDVGGNTTLAAVQVQIDPNGDFVTPEFDSGVREADLPELNLEDTAYPGLADEASTQWRVRVQDGAGLWSEWSEPVSFSYFSKGVAELISPVGDTYPEGTFSDPDPAFAWSFTGRTQKYYQIAVHKRPGPPGTPWVLVYQSAKIESQDTYHEAAENVVTEEGVRYRLMVRVWDDIERVITPGALAHSWASAYAFFEPDAAVPVVTDTTASWVSPRPHIEVNWHYHHSLPDEWMIWRDGKVIDRFYHEDEDKFEWITQTNFRYIDWTAAPHTPHRYAVRAVVNRKMSWGNFITPVWAKPHGIWLLTEDGENDICIVGDDEGSWGLGEQSTVHEVLGGDSVTVLTQALRGYEGSMTGFLVSDIPGVGLTAQEMRDRVYRIRENPSQPLRLATADLNIPVALTEIKLQPMPYEEIVYGLSFNFWQTGELPFRMP